MTAHDDRDTESDLPRTAGTISEYVAPVGPATRCEAVAERFMADPELFALPVVDDAGAPVALLNRFRLIERLSQRFGRELLLRRPILECVEGAPLMLEAATPIEEVGLRLFADDRTHILDGFIVTAGGRYVGIGTGVTLTRALTDLTVGRMKAAMEIAARENAAKSAFIANVSHEIRTPLNAVIGLTDLLLDTPLHQEQVEYTELLRASAGSLLALIDDVLDYSRIEATRFALERTPFDLHRVVAETTKLLDVRARGKALQIEAEVDPGVPRYVVGDPARLRQVLLNLGGNAVKFTDSGRVRIHVGAQPTGPRAVAVHVRVEDTGIGIAPDRMALLFKPYSQADPSIVRRFGGTGLGLAICREIVDRMSGQISVESEPGRGSVFSLTVMLELADKSAAEGAADRSVPLDAPPETMAADAVRVLVAEDNRVNQMVAASLLRRLGCEVAIAEDGAAAIDMLQRQTFDLVLMDCQMPNVDGLEATRRIRSGVAGLAAAAIPIVALTASATTEGRAEALAAGMNAYLTKPITAAALRDGILRWACRGAAA
ncbi:MAG TPA: ATP-binding protein, partial [Vicinamibacterales bacterium]|nr:ATP-binding protein [Vicinamibacterales bacterium]